MTWREWYTRLAQRFLSKTAFESEDTHDIYAWTAIWNGKDKPIYNCTKTHGTPLEQNFSGPEVKIDPSASWNKHVIYFFGEKETP